MKRALAVACIVAGPVVCSWPTYGQAVEADSSDGSFFGSRSLEDDLLVVDWNRDAVAAAAASRTRVLVVDFPLRGDWIVDLELDPFFVTGPSTRFVLGRKNAPDVPIDFDPTTISMFRGSVVGHPGSHVFLALADRGCSGFVDLGPGKARFQISSRGHDGCELSPGRVSVFRASSALAQPPGVPLCGVADPQPGRNDPALPRPNGPTRGDDVAYGARHIELAVETDFEFYILFGDVEDAATYLVQMYGQVSDIYLRDVDARMELVFARIWDDPDDLFNDVDPSPLGEFRSYWNANMGHVHRDLAQLFSGRRDYPFGGQAYLNALCGSASYSVVGYAMGFFPDPSKPSPYHYDIAVTAHELGHNAGTGHTHAWPNLIDTCDDPTTIPQRGTIMSYCGQTWSGGNANRDLYFHTRIILNMDSFISGVACVVADCNLNSIDDAIDIDSGDSADDNANGVPDECEDCNGNGVLDDADIAGGDSLDLNGNGVPDECEPDCNNNGVPDDLDIENETSLDAYGNGVPDECEPDCDGDGISDFTEIQGDMPLDIDRNTVLDACQDCDGDKITDMVAMGGAHNLWLASGLTESSIGEFYASTGVLTRRSSDEPQARVNEGQDVIITRDGRVLVSSAADDRVLQFTLQGQYLSDLVSSGAGQLDYPTGLVMLPSGVLLVASRNTDSVLAYDGASGSPLGAFVEPGIAGLTAPFGLTLGPNGNLFVATGQGEVLEFDGETGSFVRVLVSADDNGTLEDPRGLAFKPDGNLLVTSFATDETLEFNGQTGAPMGKWAKVGTEDRLTQISPWGIRVGPNGNVFVVRTGDDYGSGGGGKHEHHDQPDSFIINLHLTEALMYEFDARTGNFVRTHIGGNDHGHAFPTGFDFVYGWDIDCNLNLLPDSCDIASGFSEDANTNGIPDECEVDCNGNGVYDRLDVIPYGPLLDCNANFLPDDCDLQSGYSADVNANGVPDECDPDCNGNGIPDFYDILNKTSEDCDANGVPDECDPDCNDNGQADGCDILQGISDDCNDNGVPDTCDLETGRSMDCQPNGIPDECDVPIHNCCSTGHGSGCSDPAIEACVCVADPFCCDNDWDETCAEEVLTLGCGACCTDCTGEDCNGNAIPDECDVGPGSVLDCNDNGVPDACDIDEGTSEDCNNNSLPDECEPGGLDDCNQNGVSDLCDIHSGTSLDCNANGVPDECDLADGTSLDCNNTATPDECDIASGLSEDCQPNGVPDECEAVGHNCCETDHGSGCSDPDIEQCVCAADPFCCDVDWDETCAQEVITLGCGTCCEECTGNDCDYNGVPDECDPDCNQSGIPDACEAIGDGDFDGDGLRTLADWQAAADCFFGPDAAIVPQDIQCAETCLRAFDADLDGDIDLMDAGVFFATFDAP